MERRMRNNSNNAGSSPRKLKSPIPPPQPTRRSAFSPVNMPTLSSDLRWKNDNRDDGSLDSRLKMESQRDLTNKTGRELVDNYRNLSARKPHRLNEIVERENSSRNSDKDKDSVGSLDDGDGLSATVLSLRK
eukprot:15197525-Ditylum_brightwellii.AAC.1